MGFDFKTLLTLAPDASTKAEVTDQMWADFGRRVYANLLDEKFIKAVVHAQLAAAANAQVEPVPQSIARRIRAYLFSGTIT